MVPQRLEILFWADIYPTQQNQLVLLVLHQCSCMKCIKVSHLCKMDRKSSFIYVDGVCHNIWLNHYSSVLCYEGVKCGLLFRKWWRAISKNCPPTTFSQRGVGCNRYALDLSKLYSFCFGWTECVLAALAIVLEWVKGNRFLHWRVEITGTRQNHHRHPHVFSLSYLQQCPLPVVVSAGGRSFPGGRTGCVSFSPSVSPCSTGYAPVTQDITVTNTGSELHLHRRD